MRTLKECVVCGNTFVAESKRNKFCSVVCRKERHKAQQAEMRKQKRETQNYIEAVEHSGHLDEKNREARSLGLSYGKFKGEQYKERDKQWKAELLKEFASIAEQRKS